MKFGDLIDNVAFGTMVCVNNLDTKKIDTFICNMTREYPDKEHLGKCIIETISIEDEKTIR